MPVAAGISAVGSLGGAALGYFGSQNAANAQVQSQQAALAQQNKMFGVLQGAAQPLINAGQGVLNTGTGIVNQASGALSSLLTPGPNQTATLSQLPGFQFAQDWGQKAVTNMGTTMGLGGNTLKAGADYATGVAQQGFGSLAGLLQNYLGSGINLTGVGGNIQSAGVGALSGGATNFSGQASNTLGNIGNAQASGALGGANALAGGLTGAASGATNALLLSKLLGSSNSGGGIYGNAINAGTASGVSNGGFNVLDAQAGFSP